MAQTTTNTPGYNSRVSYKFKTDKNGRKRAYYMSRRSMRWFPAKLDEAELHVAMELADLHTHDGRPCLFCKDTWN